MLIIQDSSNNNNNNSRVSPANIKSEAGGGRSSSSERSAADKDGRSPSPSMGGEDTISSCPRSPHDNGEFYIELNIRNNQKRTINAEQINISQGSKGRTMADKLMYIHNDDTQNYPFCGL